MPPHLGSPSHECIFACAHTRCMRIGSSAGGGGHLVNDPSEDMLYRPTIYHQLLAVVVTAHCCEANVPFAASHRQTVCADHAVAVSQVLKAILMASGRLDDHAFALTYEECGRAFRRMLETIGVHQCDPWYQASVRLELITDEAIGRAAKLKEAYHFSPDTKTAKQLHVWVRDRLADSGAPDPLALSRLSTPCPAVVPTVVYVVSPHDSLSSGNSCEFDSVVSLRLFGVPSARGPDALASDVVKLSFDSAIFKWCEDTHTLTLPESCVVPLLLKYHPDLEQRWRVRIITMKDFESQLYDTDTPPRDPIGRDDFLVLPSVLMMTRVLSVEQRYKDLRCFQKKVGLAAIFPFIELEEMMERKYLYIFNKAVRNLMPPTLIVGSCLHGGRPGLVCADCMQPCLMRLCDRLLAECWLGTPDPANPILRRFTWTEKHGPTPVAPESTWRNRLPDLHLKGSSGTRGNTGRRVESVEEEKADRFRITAKRLCDLATRGANGESLSGVDESALLLQQEAHLLQPYLPELKAAEIRMYFFGYTKQWTLLTPSFVDQSEPTIVDLDKPCLALSAEVDDIQQIHALGWFHEFAQEVLAAIEQCHVAASLAKEPKSFIQNTPMLRVDMGVQILTVSDPAEFEPLVRHLTTQRYSFWRRGMRRENGDEAIVRIFLNEVTSTLDINCFPAITGANFVLAFAGRTAYVLDRIRMRHQTVAPQTVAPQTVAPQHAPSPFRAAPGVPAAVPSHPDALAVEGVDRPLDRPIGLLNPNSQDCWANACVQVLLVALRSNLAHDTAGCPPTCLRCALIEVRRAMHDGDQTRVENAMQPLRRFVSANRGAELRHWRDASEMLVECLDKMPGVHHLVEWTLQEVTVCQNCKQSSDVFSCNSMLAYTVHPTEGDPPMPSGPPVQWAVSSLLKWDFEGASGEDDANYICSTVTCNPTRQRMLRCVERLVAVPSIAFINLSRTLAAGRTYAGRRVNTTTVKLEAVLTLLPPRVPNQCDFELCAVLVSPSTYHWTAYVKMSDPAATLAEVDNDRWFYCNDSSIQEVSWSKVQQMGNKRAHMVCYRRIGEPVPVDRAPAIAGPFDEEKGGGPFDEEKGGGSSAPMEIDDQPEPPVPAPAAVLDLRLQQSATLSECTPLMLSTRPTSTAAVGDDGGDPPVLPHIAVIGAGAAGLVASTHLLAMGFRVTLYEARTRVGGRILTRRFGTQPVSVGATYTMQVPPSSMVSGNQLCKVCENRFAHQVRGRAHFAVAKENSSAMLFYGNLRGDPDKNQVPKPWVELMQHDYARMDAHMQEASRDSIEKVEEDRGQDVALVKAYEFVYPGVPAAGKKKRAAITKAMLGAWNQSQTAYAAPPAELSLHHLYQSLSDEGVQGDQHYVDLGDARQGFSIMLQPYVLALNSHSAGNFAFCPNREVTQIRKVAIADGERKKVVFDVRKADSTYEENTQQLLAQSLPGPAETPVGTRVEQEFDYVLVTVPIGVLKAMPIFAAGALDDGKRQAIDSMRMGEEIRVFLHFRASGWPVEATQLREARVGDDSLLQGEQYRFLCYAPGEWPNNIEASKTLVEPAGGCILVACASSAYAPKVRDFTQADLIKDALSVLERMIGKAHFDHAGFQAGFASHWHKDPYTRGAYTIVPPGCDQANAAAELTRATPPIYLAGEATSVHRPSWAVGAMESGEAAASLIRAQAGTDFPEFVSKPVAPPTSDVPTARCAHCLWLETQENKVPPAPDISAQSALVPPSPAEAGAAEPTASQSSVTSRPSSRPGSQAATTQPSGRRSRPRQMPPRTAAGGEKWRMWYTEMDVQSENDDDDDSEWHPTQ